MEPLTPAMAAEGWQTDGHEWIGRRVRRRFQRADGSSVLAEGTIKVWVPTDGDDPALWRVYHDDGDVEDLEESEVKTGLLAMMDSRHAALIPPPSRVAAVAGASSAPSAAQGAGGHDFGRLNPAAISLTHPLGAACFKRRVIARYRRSRGWFHGVVRTQNDDGTLDIQFDDGDHEPRAQRTDVRVMTKVRITFNGAPAPAPQHDRCSTRARSAASSSKPAGGGREIQGRRRQLSPTRLPAKDRDNKRHRSERHVDARERKVAQAPLQTETATNTKVKTKVAVTAKANAVVQARAHTKLPPQVPPQAQVEAGDEIDWRSSGHSWIGRRVRRSFRVAAAESASPPGESSRAAVPTTTVWAEGVIVKWAPATAAGDPALWHVQHEDGDEEDLEAHEVRAAFHSLSSRVRSDMESGRIARSPASSTATVVAVSAAAIKRGPLFVAVPQHFMRQSWRGAAEYTSHPLLGARARVSSQGHNHTRMPVDGILTAWSPPIPLLALLRARSALMPLTRTMSNAGSAAVVSSSLASANMEPATAADSLLPESILSQLSSASTHELASINTTVARCTVPFFLSLRMHSKATKPFLSFAAMAAAKQSFDLLPSAIVSDIRRMAGGLTEASASAAMGLLLCEPRYLLQRFDGVQQELSQDEAIDAVVSAKNADCERAKQRRLFPSLITPQAPSDCCHVCFQRSINFGSPPSASSVSTMAAQGWQTDGHEWIGRRVHRRFQAADGSFISAVGTIKVWVPADGDDPALWRVYHDDGDVEDLEEFEVKAGLLAASDGSRAAATAHDADTLLRCSHCHIPVHRSCYGVESLSRHRSDNEENWHCKRCTELFRRRDRASAQVSHPYARNYSRGRGSKRAHNVDLGDTAGSQSELTRTLVQVEREAVASGEFVCALCGINDGGAMAPTAERPRRWVHVSCVMLASAGGGQVSSNGIYFGNNKRVNAVKNLSSFSKCHSDRFGMGCDLCQLGGIPASPSALSAAASAAVVANAANLALGAGNVDAGLMQVQYNQAVMATVATAERAAKQTDEHGCSSQENRRAGSDAGSSRSREGHRQRGRQHQQQLRGGDSSSNLERKQPQRSRRRAALASPWGHATDDEACKSDDLGELKGVNRDADNITAIRGGRSAAASIKLRDSKDSSIEDENSYRKDIQSCAAHSVVAADEPSPCSTGLGAGGLIIRCCDPACTRTAHPTCALRSAQQVTSQDLCNTSRWHLRSDGGVLKFWCSVCNEFADAVREIETHADALAKIVNSMDDTTAAKQDSSSAPSLPAVAGGISIATDGPGDNGSSQVTLGGRTRRASAVVCSAIVARTAGAPAWRADGRGEVTVYPWTGEPSGGVLSVECEDVLRKAVPLRADEVDTLWSKSNLTINSRTGPPGPVSMPPSETQPPVEDTAAHEQWRRNMRAYAVEASKALQVEKSIATEAHELPQRSPPPLQQLSALPSNTAHRSSHVTLMAQRYPAAAAAAQARRAEALQRKEARDRCEHVALERRFESRDAKAKLAADRDAAEAAKWRRQACRALDERRDGKSMDRLVARLKQQWVRKAPGKDVRTTRPQPAQAQLIEHEIAVTVRARHRALRALATKRATFYSLLALQKKCAEAEISDECRTYVTNSVSELKRAERDDELWEQNEEARRRAETELLERNLDMLKHHRFDNTENTHDKCIVEDGVSEPTRRQSARQLQKELAQQDDKQPCVTSANSERNSARSQPSPPEEATVKIHSPSGQAQGYVEQVDPITRNRALKPISELNEGEFLGLRYIIHTASSTAIATDESIEQASHDTSIARATPLPRLRWQDYYSNMMLAKVAAKSMQDDCSVKSQNNRTTESKTIPSTHQSVTDNASMSCLIADHGGRVCVLGRLPMSQLEALSTQAIQARAPDDLIRRLARDVQRARAWIQQVDALLTSTTEPSRTGDDVVADDSENSPFADQPSAPVHSSTTLRPQDSNAKEGPPPLQRIDNAETLKQGQTIANKHTVGRVPSLLELETILKAGSKVLAVDEVVWRLARLWRLASRARLWVASVQAEHGKIGDVDTGETANSSTSACNIADNDAVKGAWSMAKSLLVPRSGREGSSLRRLLAHERAGSDIETSSARLLAEDMVAATESDVRGANITGVLPADVEALLLRVRRRIVAVHSWLEDARTLLKLPCPNVNALLDPSPDAGFGTNGKIITSQSDTGVALEAEASTFSDTTSTSSSESDNEASQSTNETCTDRGRGRSCGRGRGRGGRGRGRGHARRWRSSSRYLGVSLQRSQQSQRPAKYLAYIALKSSQGQRIHVGSYQCEHAAARARDAKIKLLGLTAQGVEWSWYDEKQATSIPVPEDRDGGVIVGEKPHHCKLCVGPSQNDFACPNCDRSFDSKHGQEVHTKLWCKSSPQQAKCDVVTNEAKDLEEDDPLMEHKKGQECRSEVERGHQSDKAQQKRLEGTAVTQDGGEYEDVYHNDDECADEGEQEYGGEDQRPKQTQQNEGVQNKVNEDDEGIGCIREPESINDSTKPKHTSRKHSLRAPRPDSGFVGVEWHRERQRWHAVFGGLSLGYFDDAEAAARAHDVAALKSQRTKGGFLRIKKHSEFGTRMSDATLNFPEEAVATQQHGNGEMPVLGAGPQADVSSITHADHATEVRANANAHDSDNTNMGDDTRQISSIESKPQKLRVCRVGGRHAAMSSPYITRSMRRQMVRIATKASKSGPTSTSLFPTQSHVPTLVRAVDVGRLLQRGASLRTKLGTREARLRAWLWEMAAFELLYGKATGPETNVDTLNDDKSTNNNEGARMARSDLEEWVAAVNADASARRYVRTELVLRMEEEAEKKRAARGEAERMRLMTLAAEWNRRARKALDSMHLQAQAELDSTSAGGSNNAACVISTDEHDTECGLEGYLQRLYEELEAESDDEAAMERAARLAKQGRRGRERERRRRERRRRLLRQGRPPPPPSPRQLRNTSLRFYLDQELVSALEVRLISLKRWKRKCNLLLAALPDGAEDEINEHTKDCTITAGNNAAEVFLPDDTEIEGVVECVSEVSKKATVQPRRGVFRRGKRWRVSLWVRGLTKGAGKTVSLGSYPTVEEANRVADDYENKMKADNMSGNSDGLELDAEADADISIDAELGPNGLLKPKAVEDMLAEAAKLGLDSDINSSTLSPYQRLKKLRVRTELWLAASRESRIDAYDPMKNDSSNQRNIVSLAWLRQRVSESASASLPFADVRTEGAEMRHTYNTTVAWLSQVWSYMPDAVPRCCRNLAREATKHVKVDVQNPKAKGIVTMEELEALLRTCPTAAKYHKLPEHAPICSNPDIDGVEAAEIVTRSAADDGSNSAHEVNQHETISLCNVVHRVYVAHEAEQCLFALRARLLHMQDWALSVKRTARNILGKDSNSDAQDGQHAKLVSHRSDVGFERAASGKCIQMMPWTNDPWYWSVEDALRMTRAFPGVVSVVQKVDICSERDIDCHQGHFYWGSSAVSSMSAFAAQPQLTVANALGAVAELYSLVSRAAVTADALVVPGARPLLLRDDTLRDHVAAALWVLRARSLLENNGVAAALSAVLAPPCTSSVSEGECADALGRTGLELRRLLLSVSVVTDSDRAATDDEELENVTTLSNGHVSESETPKASNVPTRRSLRQQGTEDPAQPQRFDVDVVSRKTKARKQKLAMKVGCPYCGAVMSFSKIGVHKGRYCPKRPTRKEDRIAGYEIVEVTELEHTDETELQQSEGDAAVGTASEVDGPHTNEEATSGTIQSDGIDTSAMGQSNESGTSSAMLPKEQQQVQQNDEGISAIENSRTDAHEISCTGDSTADGNLLSLSRSGRETAPEVQAVEVDCPRCRQGANPRSHAAHAENCPKKPKPKIKIEAKQKKHKKLKNRKKRRRRKRQKCANATSKKPKLAQNVQGHSDAHPVEIDAWTAAPGGDPEEYFPAAKGDKIDALAVGPHIVEKKDADGIGRMWMKAHVKLLRGSASAKDLGESPSMSRSFRSRRTAPAVLVHFEGYGEMYEEWVELPTRRMLLERASADGTAHCDAVRILRRGSETSARSKKQRAAPAPISVVSDDGMSSSGTDSESSSSSSASESDSDRNGATEDAFVKLLEEQEQEEEHDGTVHDGDVRYFGVRRNRAKSQNEKRPSSWQAYFTLRGQQKSLGTFSTAEIAARAHDAAIVVRDGVGGIRTSKLNFAAEARSLANSVEGWAVLWDRIESGSRGRQGLTPGASALRQWQRQEGANPLYADYEDDDANTVSLSGAKGKSKATKKRKADSAESSFGAVDVLTTLCAMTRRQANAEAAQLGQLVKYRRGLGIKRGRERVGQQLVGRGVLRAWDGVEYAGVVVGLDEDLPDGKNRIDDRDRKWRVLWEDGSIDYFGLAALRCILVPTNRRWVLELAHNNTSAHENMHNATLLTQLRHVQPPLIDPVQAKNSTFVNIRPPKLTQSMESAALQARLPPFLLPLIQAQARLQSFAWGPDEQTRQQELEHTRIEQRLLMLQLKRGSGISDKHNSVKNDEDNAARGGKRRVGSTVAIAEGMRPAPTCASIVVSDFALPVGIFAGALRGLSASDDTEDFAEDTCAGIIQGSPIGRNGLNVQKRQCWRGSTKKDVNRAVESSNEKADLLMPHDTPTNSDCDDSDSASAVESDGVACGPESAEASAVAAAVAVHAAAAAARAAAKSVPVICGWRLSALPSRVPRALLPSSLVHQVRARVEALREWRSEALAAMRTLFAIRAPRLSGTKKGIVLLVPSKWIGVGLLRPIGGLAARSWQVGHAVGFDYSARLFAVHWSNTVVQSFGLDGETTYPADSELEQADEFEEEVDAYALLAALNAHRRHAPNGLARRLRIQPAWMWPKRMVEIKARNRSKTSKGRKKNLSPAQQEEEYRRSGVNYIKSGGIDSDGYMPTRDELAKLASSAKRLKITGGGAEEVSTVLHTALRDTDKWHAVALVESRRGEAMIAAAVALHTSNYATHEDSHRAGSSDNDNTDEDNGADEAEGKETLKPVTGVGLHRGQWRVSLWDRTQSKTVSLGCFVSLEEANRVANGWREKHQGNQHTDKTDTSVEEREQEEEEQESDNEDPLPKVRAPDVATAWRQSQVLDEHLRRASRLVTQPRTKLECRLRDVAWRLRALVALGRCASHNCGDSSNTARNDGTSRHGDNTVSSAAAVSRDNSLKVDVCGGTAAIADGDRDGRLARRLLDEAAQARACGSTGGVFLGLRASDAEDELETALRTRVDDLHAFYSVALAVAEGARRVTLEDLEDVASKGVVLGVPDADVARLRLCATVAQAWRARTERLLSRVRDDTDKSDKSASAQELLQQLRTMPLSSIDMSAEEQRLRARLVGAAMKRPRHMTSTKPASKSNSPAAAVSPSSQAAYAGSSVASSSAEGAQNASVSAHTPTSPSSVGEQHVWTAEERRALLGRVCIVQRKRVTICDVDCARGACVRDAHGAQRWISLHSAMTARMEPRSIMQQESDRRTGPSALPTLNAAHLCDTQQALALLERGTQEWPAYARLQYE